MEAEQRRPATENPAPLEETQMMNEQHVSDPQMDRADLARACEQLSERYFEPRSATTTKPEFTVVTAVQSGRRALQKGQALRGLVGLILTMCIMAAAFVWQSSYHDGAKQVVARWAPEFVLASLAKSEEPAVDPESSRSVQADLQTSPQQIASTPPQVPPGPVAATGAASFEARELIEDIKRELADVEQQIDKIRAGQERVVKDNAELREAQEQVARSNTNLVEQLKANQEQLARLDQSTSKQNVQPKMPAPQSRRKTAPSAKSGVEGN
jgi:hypothetical protein